MGSASNDVMRAIARRKGVLMKKLMLSVLAVAALSTGAAFAQGGSADEQAGSAWRQRPDYGPAPGTPEYYGNSGWPPAQQIYPYGYAYGYGNRAYPPQAAPAYPYVPPRASRRDRERDRDGDGVRNARDRYPDDPRRW
jgi:hypothetical protein